MRLVSIRGRLLGVCGALALITGALGAGTLWAVTAVSRAYGTLARESLPAVSYVLEAERDMQRAVVAERSLLLAKGDAAAARALQSQHAVSVASAAASWRAYTRLAATDDERARQRAFEDARGRWEATTSQVMQL